MARIQVVAMVRTTAAAAVTAAAHTAAAVVAVAALTAAASAVGAATSARHGAAGPGSPRAGDPAAYRSYPLETPADSPSLTAGPPTAGAITAALAPVALGRPVVYRAPVHPVTVVRAFDPPTTPYGPGHRGVDLRVAPHAVVGSAAEGVVHFAGTVAGRGVVVVVHPDGISTEYEPLRVEVRAGEAVQAGQRLGTVSGAHGGCAPDRCLHWGAQRNGSYLDPMGLLVAPGPVRLLPWRGS